MRHTADESRKAYTVTAIVTVGFVTSIVFHFIAGRVRPASFFMGTFLYDPADRFMDYFNLLRMAENLNPYYSGLWSVYFPLSYVLVFPLTLVDRNFSFVFFFAAFLLYLAKLLHPVIVKRGAPSEWVQLAILVFLTYPVIFTIDRGNIEALLFILLSVFVLLYERERYYLSAVVLSPLIAMKLFPAVFLVLFIGSGKKLLAGALSIAIAIVSSVVSFLLLRGSLSSNIAGLMYWLSQYSKIYVVQDSGLSHGNSIWGIVKTLNYAVQGVLRIHVNLLELHPEYFTRTYLILVLGLFAFVVRHIILDRVELWKQVALLVCAMNLFPYVSGDYKLIYFFIPLALYLREEKSAFDRQFSVLFGLLLIPKAYGWIRGSASTAVVLNPVLMLLLVKAIFSSGQRMVRSQASALSSS